MADCRSIVRYYVLSSVIKMAYILVPSILKSSEVSNGINFRVTSLDKGPQQIGMRDFLRLGLPECSPGLPRYV